MPSLSAASSLKSSHSSLSSCSDISLDGHFYDRPYVEDSSTDSSREDPSLKGSLGESNGFHQNGNLAKQHTLQIQNINSFGDIREAENAEIPQETDKNLERVISSLSNDEGNLEFWLPPEPEDWEDDVIGRVASYDDDDDECGDAWARPSSLSSLEEEVSGSYRFKEEKLKAMNSIKNGKYMALVSQLLKSVGVESNGDRSENWVEIVTSLSWEAAVFVKPNSHEGKAMDPDGYVKIKCIATGVRSQSQVIKGLVFKKHASHKHMQTKYKNPRLLLIHGSLDISSGGFSSIDSMQQQEKSNLKTIGDMIENCHPNVILVEKSVSRDIQESILAKGMTLVFDMKLHRLDRVARCIGSPISSTDLSFGQELRQCESFYIEKFVEEHDFSNDGGKKPSKTLMFLEGCPSRLGCTIVLMGASSDELKRIKCVIRCAVVMAYHFMLETSFLLDQTAMFSTISPQSHAPFTLDIPMFNGFHQNEPENVMSSSKGASSISFQPYNPDAFLESSLSASIQKVMGDSFPLFSDTSERIDMQKDGYIPEFSDILNHNDNAEDHLPRKDEICAVLDSERILVLTSSRNASRGTICEKSHFSHIKFYRRFDVPLGKFLHHNLLNQGLECKTCGENPEVHVFYYAHHNKQLTIQVRRLPKGNSLPGEAEGKLWMWSRCSICQDGSSKSTKRVLISTAARDLSFGKFLQLSFSDIASFDFHSSCGHSFHKDFLYFFGLGSMVAMFKYSPVATYSVTLPPQMMEFSGSVKREFLKKDSDDVYLQGMLMFLDIEKSLKEIETRYTGVTLNIQGSSKEFSDIMLMLKQEKSQFEVEIQHATMDEWEVGAASRPLSLNRIRLQLLLESCIWDRRLHTLLSSDLKVIDTNSVVSLDLEANESSVNEIHINGQVEESIEDVSSNSCHDLKGNPHRSLSLDLEKDRGWMWAPFSDIRREYIEDLQRGYLPKIESFSSYTAESIAQKVINDEGSRLHIPLNANDYIVSDYEDEFSSIIACALALLKDVEVATEYLSEDARRERGNENSHRLTRVYSLTTSRWPSNGSSDSDGSHSPPSISEDSSHTSSFDGLDLLDSSVSYSDSHPEVSMGLGRKRKYSVVCLFASQFRQLRDRFCPSEVDFIASLSRCRNWDAKGGKSKSLFAKTLDDRLIIKEIQRTELDSFMKFATNYFEYMNECYDLRNQTCLAKILGIYQVQKAASSQRCCCGVLLPQKLLCRRGFGLDELVRWEPTAPEPRTMPRLDYAIHTCTSCLRDNRIIAVEGLIFGLMLAEVVPCSVLLDRIVHRLQKKSPVPAGITAPWDLLLRKVKVKRRGDDTKYVAKVLARGVECDLALLSVESKEFWEGVEPLHLGNSPNLQEEIEIESKALCVGEALAVECGYNINIALSMSGFLVVYWNR